MRITGGTATVSVKADNQTIAKSIKIDITPPKVTSTYPKWYATGVSRTKTIYIKFSEKIKANTYWSIINKFNGVFIISIHLFLDIILKSHIRKIFKSAYFKNKIVHIC